MLKPGGILAGIPYMKLPPRYKKYKNDKTCQTLVDFKLLLRLIIRFLTPWMICHKFHRKEFRRKERGNALDLVYIVLFY